MITLGRTTAGYKSWSHLFSGYLHKEEVTEGIFLV